MLKKLKRITPKNVNYLANLKLKGTTRELLLSALKNKLEIYQVFEKKAIFILKKGNKTVWIHRALTSSSNPIGVNIARNKHLTKEILNKLGYPTAPSKIVSTLLELESLPDELGFPLVMKPLSEGGGEGVTININNKKLLRDSFLISSQFDGKVLVEKHVEGDYYRITYVANGSYAATKNLPAYITGDGKLTALELIKKENNGNKERVAEGRLKKIKISEKTKRLLMSEGYNLSSVLPKGKKVPLCFSGFDGGEYIDVTEKIHPCHVKMAKDIADTFQLPIIGIDIIAKNIAKPLGKMNGVIIEINGTFPDIQFHNNPTIGISRNLAPALIKYLFKN